MELPAGPGGAVPLRVSSLQPADPAGRPAPPLLSALDASLSSDSTLCGGTAGSPTSPSAAHFAPPKPAAMPVPRRPPLPACPHGSGDGTCYACLTADFPSADPPRSDLTDTSDDEPEPSREPPDPLSLSLSSTLPPALSASLPHRPSLRSASRARSHTHGGVSFSPLVSQAWTWGPEEYDRQAAKANFLALYGLDADGLPEGLGEGLLPGLPDRLPRGPLSLPLPGGAARGAVSLPSTRAERASVFERTMGGVRGVPVAMWRAAAALAAEKERGS